MFHLFGIGAHVFEGDATVGVGGWNLVDVYAEFKGEFADGRGGKGAAARCCAGS